MRILTIQLARSLLINVHPALTFCPIILSKFPSPSEIKLIVRATNFEAAAVPNYFRIVMMSPPIKGLSAQKILTNLTATLRASKAPAPIVSGLERRLGQDAEKSKLKTESDQGCWKIFFQGVHIWDHLQWCYKRLMWSRWLFWHLGTLLILPSSPVVRRSRTQWFLKSFVSVAAYQACVMMIMLSVESVSQTDWWMFLTVRSFPR